MNYWILTTEYPPLYGGGISTYCYHTACMLSEKGHQVTVFICDRTIQELEINTLPEARLIRFNPSQTRSEAFLGNETNISYEFAQVVKTFIEKEGKPDIIESQDYNGIAYFLLQFKYCGFSWCKGIPILITIHSPSFLYMEYNEFPIYKKPNFWIGEMERFCIQAADLLVSPSHYIIQELKQRFDLYNQNLHVIVNPYRFSSFSVDSPDLQTTVLNNDLTFYGKLSPQKGTFRILEEFKSLWENGFNNVFTMIGGQDIVFPPMNKTMGEIVRENYKKYLRTGLLKLRDKIGPSERLTLFSEYMIFIIPSIVDNLPYVVLELMSQGKIVIVSKQGGQSEIISDEVDGFIFDYSIPGDFERVVKHVLNTSMETRKYISQKAVRKIQSVYEYEGIYQSKMTLIKNISNKARNEFPFIHLLPGKRQLADTATTKNGKLTVVVPYFNMGIYVEQTINSILNSSYAPTQIIIVNDGSTDPYSLEMLNKYRNDQRIKVIDKINTGLADSRNTGAEAAESEFLAFLDADDFVAPVYYEKAIGILKQYHNVHFVGAWTQYFGKSKSKWPTFNAEPPLILTHNCINSSALVYKKQAFTEGGKNDKSFKIGLEDYESVIQLIASGFNGVAIPEVLFYYRVRKNSMIRGVNKKIRADYYQKITEKHSLLFNYFRKEVTQLIKENEEPLNSDNSTLDPLPFQSVPLLKTVVRKLIPVIKGNPRLKKAALFIKRRFFGQ